MRAFSKLQMWKQFALSVAIIIVISIISFFLVDLVGYKSISLILLFAVTVLSLVFSVWPVLVSAILSVLIWDYFFIPPFLSFHPITSEDLLMLSMYFIIVLLNGIFTSEMRRVEKLAMQKEEKLRTLNFYNTLFNSISHELRTPITTIIGVTENILNPDNGISEKERIELNREILIATERLNQLVDNLLNMSRIESGFLEAKKSWCDVSELVYTAIDRMPENLKHRPVKAFIPENMLLVKLDFGLMEQALYNVIHNALVHTPDGTMVSVSASMRNNKLEISVEDDGPGFQFNGDNIQPETFGQKNRAGGLGLGLTIVKGFLAMHGGEMKLSNRLAGGAMVKLVIPAETMEWRENYGE
ncbi:Adaptive-response sensory-kinase SasA [anaerobic digester metagenome]